MAKNNQNLAEFGSLTGVAGLVGVPKSTLDSAAKAGHVQTGTLGDGTRVVSISSARSWVVSDRKPGRKRA